MKKLSKRSELVPNTIMAFSCNCPYSDCYSGCVSRCAGAPGADGAINSSLSSSEYRTASSAISSAYGG